MFIVQPNRCTLEPMQFLATVMSYVHRFSLFGKFEACAVNNRHEHSRRRLNISFYVRSLTHFEVSIGSDSRDSLDVLKKFLSLKFFFEKISKINQKTRKNESEVFF